MDQPRIKTMLLTDSSTIDRIIMSGLGETQYDIQSVKSNDEGFFETIIDENPDLIYLKAELVHARGIEVCERIKGHSSLQHAKVIFLSSSPDIREQAIQHRADRFLSLPFTPKDITASATALTVKKLTILYVDDSDMMHHAVVPALRDDGYLVLEAWDGQEAIELLDKSEGSVDLILSDVEMPVMDGYQLCKNVRSTSTEDIPFMLLTSLGSEDAILKGFEVGADDYILKPVVQPELLSRVRRLVRGGQTSGVTRMERVLVVDDSDVILKMIIKALNAQGFHVDSAEHGLAALSKLRERQYHLLVTDFEMPHMDGVELCQRIRNGETGQPKIPIVFATTRTTKTDIVRMRSIGAHSVIAKPFNPERVVAEVERVLTEVQLERQHQAFCHFFPEQLFSADSGQDFQAPSFAEDQFRTILSTRIINFSQLSKQLKSNEIVELINQYMGRMAALLEQSGLSIEKQVDDRISLSFGGKEVGATQAIRIALAMMAIMPEFCKEVNQSIEIGVAIHAGHVILGNIEFQNLGRQQHITLLGESVETVRTIRNHAQGGEILLSEACLELVSAVVEVEAAGSVKVLEQEDTVDIFRLKSMQESGTTEA